MSCQKLRSQSLELLVHSVELFSQWQEWLGLREAGHLVRQGAAGVAQLKRRAWWAPWPSISHSKMSDCSVYSLASVLPGRPWMITHPSHDSVSFTISQSLFKLMSSESVMPSNHLILCRSLLLLPSIFPSIRVFSSDRLFASDDQSIGASASTSVRPVNIQDWFPLGLTSGSPCSPRDSQESSPRSQFKSINFSSAQLSL